MSACILLQDVIDYEFLRFGVPVLNVCRLELDEHYMNHVFNLCICIHVIILSHRYVSVFSYFVRILKLIYKCTGLYVQVFPLSVNIFHTDKIQVHTGI